MAYRVFISHNSADLDSVRRLAAKARLVGVEAYTYEADPQLGRYLKTKIQERIGQCDALVVLLTTSGQAAPYVQQEIGVALAKGKVVVPIVEKGVEARALGMLQGVEYVVLDPVNPDLAFETVARRLGELYRQKRDNQAGIWVAVAGLIGIRLGSQSK